MPSIKVIIIFCISLHNHSLLFANTEDMHCPLSWAATHRELISLFLRSNKYKVNVQNEEQHQLQAGI